MRIFKEGDKDKSGTLSVDEFAELVSTHSELFDNFSAILAKGERIRKLKEAAENLVPRHVGRANSAVGCPRPSPPPPSGKRMVGRRPSLLDLTQQDAAGFLASINSQSNNARSEGAKRSAKGLEPPPLLPSP